MIALARRIGCTEGQLYTIVIGLAVAVVLLGIGIPPVLRDEPAASASASSPAAPATGPADPATAPSTATTSLPRAGAPPTSVPTTTAAPRSDAAPASPRPAPPAAAPPPAPTPRTVIDAGYTSSTAGSPLSGPEVPDDGMPVGVRFGRVDKVSFARLAGSDPVLRLVLVDDPAANQLVAFAAVRACAVTEPGWTLSGPGAPPEEAPAYDSDRCIDGEATPDGVWHFDLSAIGPIDDRAGIALLPVSEGPATFQVTFSTVAVTAGG